MNYAPFVWSTAIIFITTPTDNKVPRVAVCHLAGFLWQTTSCSVYSQSSALVSCPQRITAAPCKSTNMLDVKLSFFFCRRCQIMRQGWRWLVLRPHFSFSNQQIRSVFPCLCDFAYENRRASVHTRHRRMASRFQGGEVFISTVLLYWEKDEDDQWERGE